MSIAPVVADFNHANSVNFTEIAAAGIWGVIMKARQGLGFKDPAFASRRALAEQLGLLVGGYDFATHDDVAANVAAFHAAAIPDKSPKVGLWLDFEDNVASEMTGDQAWEFLDRSNQITGRACGIYGGNRLKDIDPATQRPRVDPQAPKWIDMAKVAPLWQCRYVKLQPADTAELFRVIPPIAPWTANTLIQYTGDGVGPTPHTVQGLQNGADLNAFNGTREQLAAIWAGAPIEQSVPGPAFA